MKFLLFLFVLVISNKTFNPLYYNDRVEIAKLKSQYNKKFFIKKIKTFNFYSKRIPPIGVDDFSKIIENKNFLLFHCLEQKKKRNVESLTC